MPRLAEYAGRPWDDAGVPRVGAGAVEREPGGGGPARGAAACGAGRGRRERPLPAGGQGALPGQFASRSRAGAGRTEHCPLGGAPVCLASGLPMEYPPPAAARRLGFDYFATAGPMAYLAMAWGRGGVRCTSSEAGCGRRTGATSALRGGSAGRTTPW